MNKKPRNDAQKIILANIRAVFPDEAVERALKKFKQM